MEKQFRAEVSSIGVIQHVNLVRLVGFCCEGESRFLVYEHMPNRSLDIHLFKSGGGVFLDWGTRYQIAVGFAGGLFYSAMIQIQTWIEAKQFISVKRDYNIY